MLCELFLLVSMPCMSGAPPGNQNVAALDQVT